MRLPPRLVSFLIRVGLFAGFIALLGFIVAFGRRVGLGEWALLLSIIAIVVGIESVRYIVRQFLKGYRGERK